MELFLGDGDADKNSGEASQPGRIRRSHPLKRRALLVGGRGKYYDKRKKNLTNLFMSHRNAGNLRNYSSSDDPLK